MRADVVPLDDDKLQLFVFGPGFGESIAVRVPPGEWLVIDSLRRQSTSEDVNPVLGLLKAHGAYASAVALTHPHEDHGRGLVQLLERRTPGSAVGCLDPTLEPRRVRDEQDAAVVLDQGSLIAGLRRIREIWRVEPEAEWVLVAGATRSVGDGQVKVLSPDEVPDRLPTDPNRISNPMLVSWHDATILLGADLPRRGWRRIERTDPKAPDYGTATAYKAAHHGSKGAPHWVAIGAPPPKGRPCVVTPFNKGRQLPSYETGHGIDQLLDTHEQVTVTVVPAHARGRTLALADMRLEHEAFGDFDLTYEVTPSGVNGGWAAVAITSAGVVAQHWCGDDAGMVTR